MFVFDTVLSISLSPVYFMLVLCHVSEGGWGVCCLSQPSSNTNRYLATMSIIMH